MRRFPLRLLALLVTAIACTGGGSTAEDSGARATLGEPFALARGSSTVVAGEDLRVTFVDVQGDSRCPKKVVCVWAGDAAVVVRATKGGASEDVVLHTTPSGEAAPGALGYRFELGDLSPYPDDPGGVKPEAYVARLTVRK